MDKPGQRLEGFAGLTADGFIAEVKRRRPRGVPRLAARDLTALAVAHTDYTAPARTRATRVITLEHRLSDLVLQAYGLTADEVALMWRTAPPRMPVPGRVP